MVSGDMVAQGDIVAGYVVAQWDRINIIEWNIYLVA